jgi:hypothetical protein
MRVIGKCMILKDFGENKRFEVGTKVLIVKETETHIFLGVNKEDLDPEYSLRFEVDVR